MIRTIQSNNTNLCITPRNFRRRTIGKNRSGHSSKPSHYSNGWRGVECIEIPGALEPIISTLCANGDENLLNHPSWAVGETEISGNKHIL